MAMKRTLNSDERSSTAQPSSATDVDVDAMKKAYKRAKKAYKQDKSNEELKKAKSEAKKALKRAEGASNEVSTSSSETTKDTPTIELASDGNCEKKDNNNNATTPEIKQLEEAYQKALSAFKADKSNKDLRRAKTAARRAVDEAILATSTDGTKQLTCVNCSKMFLFTAQEQERYKQMGWEDESALPKRCEACKTEHSKRVYDRRTKLDSQKKNMCYAFQRGECPHGSRCKFSHNPKHGGKRSNVDDEASTSEQRGNEERTTADDVGMESKVRKEQSLRKKRKGWRNK